MGGVIRCLIRTIGAGLFVGGGLFSGQMVNAGYGKYPVPIWFALLMYGGLLVFVIMAFHERWLYGRGMV